MSRIKEVNKMKNIVETLYNDYKTYVPLFGVIYYIYAINIFSNGTKVVYYSFKFYIPLTVFVYYIYFLEAKHDD